MQRHSREWAESLAEWAMSEVRRVVSTRGAPPPLALIYPGKLPGAMEDLGEHYDISGLDDPDVLAERVQDATIWHIAGVTGPSAVDEFESQVREIAKNADAYGVLAAFVLEGRGHRWPKGDHVLLVFEHASFEPPTRRRIWRASVVERDGALDLDEFSSEDPSAIGRGLFVDMLPGAGGN